VQARFWTAIASRAASSPAVLGYDLMNEPVVPGDRQERWVADAELDGLHFIQHISRDRAGRSPGDIARAWTKLQADAVRRGDPRALVTIGMLPAFSGFDPEDVASALDFESAHLYPTSGREGEAADLLRRRSRPVLVEEFGPIHCSVPELERFVRANDPLVAGWLGFYWGKTPSELHASDQIADALLFDWLAMFARVARARSYP
jgi:hypothetical protein